MFAEQGFHGTSMRDLGKKLGLMGSSLYSHVVSKDELLVDVVREASSRFQALADEVATMSGTANERLSRLVHGHLHILVEDPHQARTFLNETRFLPEPERDKAVTMFDRYQQVFRDVLSSGCAAGEFRSDLNVQLAANLVLSLLNGTQRWFNVDGALSVDSLAMEVHFLLTLGLSPDPEVNAA
jgi:AcrR family transcriptional regulator